jgi:hypothetical protein
MSTKITPSTPITIHTGDAEAYTTLAAFVDDNRDGLSLQDIENIEDCLNRGAPWHGGGGAAGAYTIERRRLSADTIAAESLKEMGYDTGSRPSEEHADDLSDEQREAFREAARKMGCGEVDADAVVSRGSDPGAYVACWVWVTNEQAGICDPDEEGDASRA